MALFHLVEWPLTVKGKRVTLYVPEGYYNITSEEKLVICNGCGPGNWKFDIVPDTIYGLSIAEVCNVHDYMYYHGIDTKDKWFADAVFLLNGCLLVMWTADTRLMRVLRTMRMVWYYLAVATFGDKAFRKYEQGVNSRQKVHGYRRVD
jgi:hypothetical protein